MQQPNVCTNVTYKQGIISSSLIPLMQQRVTFNPPVSTALYGTTTTASWAHTVPPYMPWMTQANSSGSRTKVVHFSASDARASQTLETWEQLKGLNISNSSPPSHVVLKRKNEVEWDGSPPKQLITEEKLTSRMRELHITSDAPATISAIDHFNNGSQKPEPSFEKLSDMLLDDSSQSFDKSLILAPEIRCLVEPEKLFARTLMKEIYRPSMAVMVWKPPQKYLSSPAEQNKDQQVQNILSKYDAAKGSVKGIMESANDGSMLDSAEQPMVEVEMEA